MKNFTIRDKKLGKRAPKLDNRTLKLAKYLAVIPPPPPPRKADYLSAVTDWPMYLNNTLSTCAIASPGHMVEAWTTAATGTTVKVTDADILKAYSDVGGYIPGVPWTDQGCFLLDVMNYWRKTGIGGHKIELYVSVNVHDRVEIRQSIELFGEIIVGLSLPLTAQDPIITGDGKPRWEIPPGGAVGDASPGSWGGHAVSIGEYSKRPNEFHGLQLVTWGQVYKMTWQFLEMYCDEAYVPITKDWLNEAGKSPHGLDLLQLEQDLILVTTAP